MNGEEPPSTRQTAKFARTIKWGNVLRLAIFAVGALIALAHEKSIPVETVERCPITKANPRPILSSDVQASSLWSRNIKMENFAVLTNLMATSDFLFAATYCPNSSVNFINAFDLQSGNLGWSSEPMENILNMSEAYGSLAVSTLAQIALISTENGKSIWTNSDPALSNNYHLLQEGNGNQLIVYTGELGINWIDRDFGNVQASIPVPSSADAVLYDKGQIFSFMGNTIQAHNLEKNLILWSLTLGDISEISLKTHRPHVEGDFLLIHWGSNGRYISVINKLAGNVVWQFTDVPVVSNVVVKNKVAYLLDAQARLILFNVESGSYVGAIQFEKLDNQPDSLDQLGKLSGSWLAVQDNIVAIYFQDTELLNVYKISFAAN